MAWDHVDSLTLGVIQEELTNLNRNLQALHRLLACIVIERVPEGWSENIRNAAYRAVAEALDQ